MMDSCTQTEVFHSFIGDVFLSTSYMLQVLGIICEPNEIPALLELSFPCGREIVNNRQTNQGNYTACQKVTDATGKENVTPQWGREV